jgi:pimeloyl-ACP methyl ester carboxylesterase
MPFVAAADGTQLYAEAHGSGEPIVFSPGYVQTHENFRAQVEPFVAAGYRVVLWDYRGHGRSQAPEDPSAYSIEHVVSDLGRVLDWAAPGRRAICAGLSFGGLASQHFALAHPERVSALVLIATGPGFKNPKAQADWLAQIERIAQRVEKNGFAGYTSGPAQTLSIGLKPDVPAARAAAREIEAQSPRGVATFGRRVSGPAPATLDRLAEISAPTLILVGALDTGYLRAAEVMSARIPGAKSVTIEGAGHCVNIEQTDAFNRAVLGFLAARG